LGETPRKLDFDRDVRHILAQNCYACHGFDEKERKAGLRLDEPAGAYAVLKSGKAAVVPGKPELSSLVERIRAKGPVQMPPPGSKKSLTPKQIEVLEQWVKQGGKYTEHWAFIPPKKPTLPSVQNLKWVRTPIDRFVLARLEKEGLKPSPEADRATLLRRLSLDLTGLPPTPAEVDAFIADRRNDAYERQVDRLLASPHYGERLALKWLDLARYADTHGYHIDSHRDMWRWRDWVIDAFNKNLPFNDFVVQQLAGDMLPNATLDQKIASGFNRNHPINFEGGAIPEEYHANYIFDRIDTTATTFMGLTMRCAQCHNHKYEPISQKDFYRFYAFFHNVPENGLDGTQGNARPFIRAPLPGQMEKLAEMDRRLAELETTIKERASSAGPRVAEWEKNASAQLDTASTLSNGLDGRFPLDEKAGRGVKNAAPGRPNAVLEGVAVWTTGRIGNALQFDGNLHVDIPGGDFERTDAFSYGAWVYPTSNGYMTVVSKMDDALGVRGWDMFLGDGKVFVHLIHQWDTDAVRLNTKAQIPQNQWSHLFATYDGSGKAAGVKIYINGRAAETDTTHDRLTGTIKTTRSARIGRRTPSAPFTGLIDEVRLYSRTLSSAEVAQLAGVETIRQHLTVPAESRTPAQTAEIAKYYLETVDPEYRRLTAEAADLRRRRNDFERDIPTTMVMEEMPTPRDTFILTRGEYDKKGEKVTAGVPALFSRRAGEVRNRLELAKWLTDPSHPLTSRVAVNRFWQMLFGVGIVKSAENFGTQGEMPSHPELLDWLSTEFVRINWDVKALLRTIVTSSTYRQSSRATPELYRRDPENRLLARGPRHRLQAEFVKDLAMTVSGLLNPAIGGPSVKPYHPAGLWEEMAFGGEFTAQKYVQDHGDKLYRRGMYTFWKRTCPPPSLQTFDAPEREFCVVRRSATNTPLQALVLMNDPTYVEASRKFAERILKEGSGDIASRIAFATKWALSRPPKLQEVQVLTAIYRKQFSRFRLDTKAAEALLSVGESPRDQSLDTAQLAAWTVIAQTILNLDETITKG
jgi:hypothetical protein